MTSLNSTAFRLSLAVAGVAGALCATVPAASAQDQDQAPEGWFKLCGKEADIDTCNVQVLISAPTGQLVTAVNLVDMRGKVNRKVFQVTVPSGRLVPPGIALQIDGGKPQKLDYVVCFPATCVAEVPLTDQLVSSFKKGQQITLTSVNFQNQPNPIKIPLTGFSDAFDGPALKPSQDAARQKALEDYAAKHQEENNRKLKEAQDAAKAGN